MSRSLRWGDKQALLVMFICHHCPFVKHVKSGIGAIRTQLRHAKGVGGSIRIERPACRVIQRSSPQEGLKRIAAAHWALGSTAVCYDETQAVAKSYAAACTPDFYLFDQDRRLVYRGQLDDSRPSNGKPVTGADLRAAIDMQRAAWSNEADQRPGLGCNIKWRRAAVGSERLLRLDFDQPCLYNPRHAQDFDSRSLHRIQFPRSRPSATRARRTRGAWRRGTRPASL